MRVALISALERVVDGTLRAFLPLGGRPVIAWQMDLAKALGCDRLLCLCDAGEVRADELKELAGSAGIPLELIGGPRHLLTKVSADQDIVLIADGLVVDTDIAFRVLNGQRGVVTLPDQPAVEIGFERIDAESAWSGLLVSRGSIIQQLADLPADSDAMSVLLRLALQAGVKRVLADDDALANHEFVLVRDRKTLARKEQALLDFSAERSSLLGPGSALAAWTARRIAPRGLVKGPAISLGAGVLLLLTALGAASAEAVLPALIALAAGALSLHFWHAIRRLRSRLHGRLFNERFLLVANAIIDLTTFAVLVMAAPEAGVLGAIFLPLLFVGLWRLASGLSSPRFEPFWRDRTIPAVILAILAAADVLTRGLPLSVLVLLAICLIYQTGSRLTRA